MHTVIDDDVDKPTRTHIRRFYRPFYRRGVFWLGLLVVLVLVARLALDPVATHYTRKALTEMDGFEGRFGDVQVEILPPGYAIVDLKLVERPGGSWKQPLLYAERIEARVDWRRLFRGRLAASVRVDRPKVTVVQRKGADDEKDRPAARLPDLGAALAKAPPVEVPRIEIRSGEILYRDPTLRGAPELWLHRIEATVENIATRTDLRGGRPTTVSVRAELQRSGVVTSFLSVDPFADGGRGLTFSGRTQLRGLRLADLHDVLVASTDVKPSQGTVDMFAEYRAEDGAISGGVKPVLKNVEIRPTDGSLGNRLKAWLADSALDLFSDRVPGRNAVATTIPIKGKLTGPEVQVLPTVLGVIRNAFIEGLASGFANLPPETAAKPEGPVQQVKEAVTGDEPPRAQP